MKNLKVKILVGIPGAGKTTWATNYVLNNKKWVRVSRDEYRFMLKGDYNNHDEDSENLITSLVLNTAKSALDNKFNVIIDNTNLKADNIKNLIKNFINYADIEFEVFNISLEEALQRDELRVKKVGPNVINKMWVDYNNIINTFDFTTRLRQHKIHNTYIFNDNKPTCAVFDLDGTLAHHNGKRNIFAWNKVDLDDLDTQVYRMYNLHKNNGDKIIIVTGRSSESKEKTIEWLNKCNIQWDEIYMREAKDFRKDTIVKKEIFEKFIIQRYNVACVYDDRDSVVHILRKIGLKVFQVEKNS